MIKAEEFTHKLAWILPSVNLQTLRGNKTPGSLNRIENKTENQKFHNEGMNKFRKVKLQNCWERNKPQRVWGLLHLLINPPSQRSASWLPFSLEILTQMKEHVHWVPPLLFASLHLYHQRHLIITGDYETPAPIPSFLSRSHSVSLQGCFSKHFPSASCVIKFSLYIDYTDQHRNILFFYFFLKKGSLLTLFSSPGNNIFIVFTF